MEKIADALVVFAKFPEPGKVKTRLAADIGAAAAADLYREFLFLTLETATALRDTDVVIAFSPADRLPQFEQLIARDCRFVPQPEGDLGRRMERVFAEFLQEYKRAVIIGTDSPTLPAAYLRQAFSALEGSDVVFGPTEDGGYYLVGLRAPQPLLFAGIPWSTDAVLEATLERARESALAVHLLPTWHDIDTLADLRKALLYDHGTLRDLLKRCGLANVCYSCVQPSTDEP